MWSSVFNEKKNLVVLVGSLVRPKVKKSVHYCEKTEKTTVRNYKDATSIGPFSVESNFYPTKVCASLCFSPPSWPAFPSSSSHLSALFYRMRKATCW